MCIRDRHGADGLSLEGATDEQAALAVKKMVEAGVDTAVMEVSSHSLFLKRVYGIRFQGAIFTNLSQDHLDFHGDFEHYRDAKALLFAQAEHSAINADDPVCKDMIAAAAGEVKTCLLYTSRCV